MYYMEDAKSRRKSKWHSCACGVIFQKDKPEGVYDAAYLKKESDPGEKYRLAAQYPVRIYAPLIEELTYGRKALVVGTPTFRQVEAFKDRGWVTYSIDKNLEYLPSSRHFQGDFETYDFGDQKFNLIWMYSVLECFLNPKETLKKCFTLLPEDGILFIATPDTDFVYTRSSAAFVHWRPEYNNVMWNKRALTSLLESLGFQTIMCRRNLEQRFPAVDDVHGIFQKRYY